MSALLDGAIKVEDFETVYLPMTVSRIEAAAFMADNIKEFGITAMISVPAVFDIIYRKVMKAIEKKGKLQIRGK